MLEDYRSLFAFSPTQIGRTNLIEHEIRTTDARPVRRGPYKCFQMERKVIKDQILEYLDMGIVSPSQSPWGTGVVFIKKPDGTYRFSAD